MIFLMPEMPIGCKNVVRNKLQIRIKYNKIIISNKGFIYEIQQIYFKPYQLKYTIGKKIKQVNTNSGVDCNTDILTFSIKILKLIATRNVI